MKQKRKKDKSKTKLKGILREEEMRNIGTVDRKFRQMCGQRRRETSLKVEMEGLMEKR